MENTPQALQTTDLSFDPSVSSLYQSTPSSENANTPKHYKLSRKRKASFLEISHENYNARKLAEIMESSPTTPQFSSTFNESLMNNLEKIHIHNEDTVTFLDKNRINFTKPQEDETHVVSSKLFNRSNVKKMYSSAPSTPEKQIKLSRDVPKKANTNSFIKHLSLLNVQSHSPLNKDAYDILYPSLPSLERQRLPPTPQKYCDKSATPVKKCLFFKSHKNLFDSIIFNGIIMNKILGYLSNGDLFRLAQVSKSLKKSILSDWQASVRYTCYIQVHENQKENYRITPPSSPEKDSGYEDASPASKNYLYFMEIASSLTKNQSITKCPRCNKAAVVENFIGQCQELNRCGYIFCLKCNSFANNPKDFKDECKNAQLLNNSKPRNLLSDLSNSTFTSDYVTDSASSFFSSSLNLNSSRYDSSGIFSECENSTPKQSVKRNLSKSLINSEVKVLSSNNITRSREYINKAQHKASVVPVLPLKSKKMDEIVEPSSPPKVKQYSACSKQSKRNLKSKHSYSSQYKRLSLLGERAQVGWAIAPEERDWKYRLSIYYVKPQDSGTFTCATPRGITNSITLHVSAIHCEPISVSGMHLSVRVEGTRLGHKAIFQCPVGFHVLGEANLTCQASGKWSGSVPKCDLVKCPSLDTPGGLEEPHLQLEEHNNSYGGRAVFSCAWGYKLLGPPGIECELHGNWSGPLPRCVPIQCPPPVLPVNGHLIQSEAPGMDGGRYAVGSLVQFACQGAHYLEGEASIICTETGFWSHPPPFCKPRCSYIGEPKNGFISPTKFAYDPGDELEILCNAGFETTMETRPKCLSDGKWSSALPACTESVNGTTT